MKQIAGHEWRKVMPAFANKFTVVQTCEVTKLILVDCIPPHFCPVKMIKKGPKTPGNLLEWVSHNSLNRQEIPDHGPL